MPSMRRSLDKRSRAGEKIPLEERRPQTSRAAFFRFQTLRNKRLGYSHMRALIILENGVIEIAGVRGRFRTS